jgi:hypothetical protein
MDTSKKNKMTSEKKKRKREEEEEEEEQTRPSKRQNPNERTPKQIIQEAANQIAFAIRCIDKLFVPNQPNFILTSLGNRFELKRQMHPFNLTRSTEFWIQRLSKPGIIDLIPCYNFPPSLMLMSKKEQAQNMKRFKSECKLLSPESAQECLHYLVENHTLCNFKIMDLFRAIRDHLPEPLQEKNILSTIIEYV